MGSVPGWGTKIPHAAWRGQNENKRRASLVPSASQSRAESATSGWKAFYQPGGRGAPGQHHRALGAQLYRFGGFLMLKPFCPLLSRGFSGRGRVTQTS